MRLKSQTKKFGRSYKTMNGVSRRDFIRNLGVTGLAASLAGCDDDDCTSGQEDINGCRRKPLRAGWLFRSDPEDRGLALNWHQPETGTGNGWEPIEVPHTWQVREETAEYLGAVWYRGRFEAPAAWADKLVRVEFEAVYHSAQVWVNGIPVGEHLRKGYTTFTLDISVALRPGQDNLIAVRVDNAFDDQMLPRGSSFDWTPDGGIIRPVSLIVTGRTFIDRIDVDALPDLQAGKAELDLCFALRNAQDEAVEVEVSFRVEEEATGKTVLSRPQAAIASLDPGESREIRPARVEFDQPKLWHFDHPQLYRLVAEISCAGRPLDRLETTFGVRRFEVRNNGFYLNGERVRLMGVERMGGSDPAFGMAEPTGLIDRDHGLMKELNCVFTRVHWQQDRRVLDYCDRHGILLQEEVPTWGPATFEGMQAEPDPAIMQNALEQLREMISRDRNHPSVFAWGLCNEIGGQNPPAYKFAQRLYEEASRLDPHRLRTYASNSLAETCEKDVSALMDFVEWNEYYESWYKGSVDDMKKNLERIHQAFPDKPVVISEYGYCQCRPDRTGGDKRTAEILRTHTDAYREYDYVAGAIFFCLNDYRTHIGDKGRGALKQRVHGVLDLYGEPKPSFAELRGQSSPAESLVIRRSVKKFSAVLAARTSLPSYRLEGYRLRLVVYGFQGLPMESHDIELPAINPGDKLEIDLPFAEEKPVRLKLDLLRPTGFSVFSAGWEA